MSISWFADTDSVGELFIDSAGRASFSVLCRLSSSRADGADSTDSAKTFQTSASLGGEIDFLIGAAFPGADTVLTGEET